MEYGDGAEHGNGNCDQYGYSSTPDFSQHSIYSQLSQLKYIDDEADGDYTDSLNADTEVETLALNYLSGSDMPSESGQLSPRDNKEDLGLVATSDAGNWGDPVKANGHTKTRSDSPMPPDDHTRTKPWRELLYDYTQYSTLHGVSYTTQTTRFTIRRVIWGLLVLSAVGGFLYYIADRVQVYLRYDTNVNVVVNYAETVEFPAVTICNQNPFKLTSAVYGGWYDEVIQIVNGANEIEVTTSNSPECTKEEFKCHVGSLCIPIEQLCDLFPDCQDSSDETNCDPCLQVVVTSSVNQSSIPLMDGAYVLASGLMTGYSDERIYMQRSFNDFKLILSNDTINGAFQWTLRYENKSAQSEILENNPFGKEVDWTDLSGSSFTVGIACQGVTVVKQKTSTLATQPKKPQMTLRELYEQGSHNKSQFFLFERCKWKGNPMVEADFKVSFTEYGLCHTFYPNEHIEKSGPGYGLGLTLNVEQYEYVKDSRSGVGIQMLLHDPTVQPLLQEQSMAISPGLYSLLAVERTELNSLEFPWGNCSEKSLNYYNSYSVTNCILDGEIKTMSEKCDCTDLYMQTTDRKESKPVCDIGTYINCSLPAIDEYRQRGVECKKPCNQKLYVPSLSFSSITFNNDMLSQSERKQMNELQQSLAEAREITYRIRDDHYRNTMRVFDQVLSGAWATHQTLEASMEILKNETRNVTHIGALVNTDCIEHNSHLQNLSINMGSEVMTFMKRLVNHINLNVTASTRALQLQIKKTHMLKGDLDLMRSEGLVLAKNLTSNVNDRVALLLRELASLVTSTKVKSAELGGELQTPVTDLFDEILTDIKSSIVNLAAYVTNSNFVPGLSSKITNTKNELTKHLNNYVSYDNPLVASQIVDIAETLNVSDIYEGLVESTADIHIPLGHTIQPYVDLTITNIQTAFAYTQELLNAVFDLPDSSTFPFTLRGKYVKPLLKYVRSQCDWCIGRSDEKLVELLETNLANTLCPKCSNGFATVDMCSGPKVTDKGVLNRLCLINQSMTYLADALMSTPGEYLVDGSISNAISEANLQIIQQGNYLSAQLQSTVTEATGKSRLFVKEFMQQMTPKCMSELRKLYDEYIDVDVRTTNLVKEAKKTISKFNKAFSAWKIGYSSMPNITLEQVRNDGLLTKARKDVSSKILAIESLLNERNIAVDRMASHIDKLYYWLLAQLPGNYLVNYSKFWAEFDIPKDVATETPDPLSSTRSTLVPLHDEFSLNSDDVNDYWAVNNCKLTSVRDDLIHQLHTFVEKLTIAQNYLDEFSNGNSVSDSFYKTNFLQMEVYYKELTERAVVHQKSYEYPALLSEIGGLMGLLLGASVITILECLDLLVVNAFDKCLNPRRKGALKTEYA